MEAVLGKIIHQKLSWFRYHKYILNDVWRGSMTHDDHTYELHWVSFKKAYLDEDGYRADIWYHLMLADGEVVSLSIENDEGAEVEGLDPIELHVHTLFVPVWERLELFQSSFFPSAFRMNFPDNHKDLGITAKDTLWDLIEAVFDKMNDGI